jgi:hypothetical protein
MTLLFYVMLLAMTLTLEPVHIVFLFVVCLAALGCWKLGVAHLATLEKRRNEDAQYKASVLAALCEMNEKLTAIENNKDHPATPVMKELVIGLGYKVSEHTRSVNAFRALMFPQEANGIDRVMPPLPMDDGPGYEEREIAERMSAGMSRDRAVAAHEAAIRDFQKYASRTYATPPSQSDDHMTMS